MGLIGAFFWFAIAPFFMFGGICYMMGRHHVKVKIYKDKLDRNT